MIPRDFITEWSRHAPWSQTHQIEQDLVICRALIEIFSQPGLADRLAFRGGTAIFKLYRKDIKPRLVADTPWNFEHAFAYIKENLIILIPGDPWRG